MQLDELLLIGYWSNNGLEFPNPKWFVDNNYSDKEKKDVIDHLKNAVVVHGHRGFCPCRICGKITPSTDLSDGKFYFPGGLLHYVEEHNVRLPKRFIKNIGKHNLTFSEKKWLQTNFCALKINKTWWQSQREIYRLKSIIP